MKPRLISERSSMDVHGGAAGGAGKYNHRRSSSSSSSFFSKTAEQLAATVARTRRCATRRALPAVCVAAALLGAAVVVLTAASGSNWMPASLVFFHDAQEDMPPSNLTAEQLLDGLLTPQFSYRSCRSRYEFADYHKKSSHKPSPYLIAKLRKQEALQKRCGPGTASYRKALWRLEAGEGVAVADADNDDDDCRYLVNISYRGLGNRMLAITSTFLYAVLTERVLLVDEGKDKVADLFCEPFPGTTWLLPRIAWWWKWLSRSPLKRLRSFDDESKERLGNLLQSGAVDGNVSWSSARTPPFVLLNLDGAYGYHDKLFFCGAHQRLLRRVPWLLMRTDNYMVPGLFLTPPFRDELEAMFPEKDAAFHLVGRYLFHPSNAVWNAVTSFYRANLAGAGRRVGIQIRVFHDEQPRERVLDQVRSCVRDHEILPPPSVTNDTSSVVLTSLSSWYFERIRDEYAGRVAGGVHQPSHEEQQRWDDTTHDMRALGDMCLLSMCDVLVTSGFSTFGYVAQGLAGLRPWVMASPNPWAKNWTEGLDPHEPPCRRMASIEPCFHSPSAYDCAAGREIDPGKVTPYIRHCVDVRWGIKLVNGSSSSNQW